MRQEYVDRSLQQARLTMLWRVPGLNNLSQTYALDVLANVLGTRAHLPTRARFARRTGVSF